MKNLSSLSKAQICLGLTLLCMLGGYFSSFYLVALAIGIITLATGFYFIQNAQESITRATDACKKLGNGDFETRLTNIAEDGEISEFLWSVNEMTDFMDAFVRESTAAMEYVSRNQYFRRIIEDGMHGNLLNGARVINQATLNVADKMDSFVGIADDVDNSLKQVVSQINSTVETLENGAQTMGDTVASTRQGAETVVLSSNEMSMNVQTISAAAEEMSSSIAEISTQITKTSTMASEAVHDADQARKIINALATTAASINEVITLIEDIAEQTNLLALNATIEAARAGEAGKGFAIVASEVKNLAAETAKATDDIRQQINEVQGATNSAVSAFDGIGKSIADISEACTVVAAAVEEQNAASLEIASNAQKASTATNTVAENIQEIGTDITKVDEISSQVVDATEQLSSHSKDQVEALLNKMGVFMGELKKIA
ncbi:MAG: methyl-accepting chemotaxis protein [Rhodospirillales bacterium]|nr:methyl-accepting chemotaxis protein [Alphaproteobacteria bacterium]MCB9981272.1 methyl-accepting chemotaxis protein [Rhodospirillales bacterium]